ncbi:MULTISPECIES: glutathione peroxidase [Arthrobacter]|uniref:glutathione peroxidase n=1 Tax=Arthrobacter TaxID=1663 RepID=UPI0025B47AB5|nr:glutathione peroxidase [Arthrobacter sp. YD2]MDN3905869.1 glutathione peroxidase [Arthrobacter sp. YD2]
MQNSTENSTLYGIPLTLLDGTETTFGDLFRGKAVLVVNVASRCGYTQQYEGLQALYETYQHRNFAVLGVPSNQFAGQEPGTAEDIAEFCSRNYGVSFPLAAKTDVNGPARHPLYAELTKFRDGDLGEEIGWNFEKFLVTDSGEVVGRFASAVAPGAPEIQESVEAVLRLE